MRKIHSVDIYSRSPAFSNAANIDVIINYQNGAYMPEVLLIF